MVIMFLVVFIQLVAISLVLLCVMYNDYPRYTPSYVFDDIIHKLNIDGFSNSRIERAFNFKRGYCSKLIKKGSWDICDKVLFNILENFPYAIKIAEDGYDEAKRLVILKGNR